MVRLLSALAGILWVLAVLHILVPSAPLTWAMTGFLVCFVALAIPRISWHTQVLCGVLAAATVVLAAHYGQWDAVPEGVARAAIFPGFLSTIVLLRAAADQRPEIASARRMFGVLDPARRDSGIVIGTHLIGAVLQVGVFAILAPILGRDASVAERREVFTAAIRGMSLVPFWSPFVIGMAVASQYLPHVPLWQIMSLGLALTTVGIAISVLVFDRNRSAAGLRLALQSLAPVALPIVIAALIVVATTAMTGFSTLQALIIALPIPCLLAIVQIKTGSVTQVLRQTAAGIGRIGPETSILTFATILGVVFEASLPHTGLLDWLKENSLPAAGIVFAVILSMSAAGLVGIHPIVSGTVLLVIFTSIPTGVADLVMMQALLIGWGLSSGISIGSLSIATGAAMFKISPTDLVTRTNIVFVFLTSVITGILLTGLNTLLV